MSPLYWTTPARQQATESLTVGSPPSFEPHPASQDAHAHPRIVLSLASFDFAGGHAAQIVHDPATVGIVTVTDATTALAAGAYVKNKCDKAQNKKDSK